MNITDDAVLKTINHLDVSTAWKISHLWGSEKAIDVCSAIEDYETLEVSGLLNLMQNAGFGGYSTSMAHDLALWSYEIAEEKAEKYLARKMQKLALRTANKMKYLPEAELTRYVVPGSKARWTADGGVSAGSDLRSLGLLPMAIEHIHGTQKVPVVVSIQNGMPREEDSNTGEAKGPKEKIEPEQWHNLAMHGIVVSGERLGWTMNTPAWPWLLKLFPKVINLAAYNHSLNSPVLPNGFFPECDVVMTTIRSQNGDVAGCDGSGRYHPQTAFLQPFVEKYGAVTFQFRYITRQGTFAKGILVPDERCITDGTPTVWLDWAQIKGSKKETAAAWCAEGKSFASTGYMGIIKCWSKPGRISVCFEAFENVKNTVENQKLVESLIDEEMGRLREDGPEGLVAKVARDDQRVKTILQLTTAMKSLGADISPLQIGLVQAAVDAKLGKRKYEIASGTGHKAPVDVFVIDNQVPEGKCVIAGHPVGTKLAVFRFPIVVAQGLVTLEVIPPIENHLVDGEGVPFTMYMNEADIVTKMQGDDDGDDGGADTDPRMLKLWASLVDDSISHIEPVGIKFDTKSETPEGFEYLRYDQRGDVGRLTVYRARLLAINDDNAAKAISLMIQEAIDCAKRRIEWSNWKMAVNPANWDADERGELHFSHKLSPEEYGPDGEMPMDEIKDWVVARLNRAGVEKASEASLWRYEKKRIPAGGWMPAKTENVEGNLVHHAHDYALSVWTEIEDEFEMGTSPISINNLMTEIFTELGMNIQPVKSNWETYVQGLRYKCGLRKFGKAFSTIHTRQLDDDARFQEIDRIIDALHVTLKTANLSLQELVTVWYMESTPRWSWKTKIQDANGKTVTVLHDTTVEAEAPERAKQCNNPNHAFRVAAWDGSPIMEALGIESETNCQFLTPKLRQACLSVAMGDTKLWKLEDETTEEQVERNSRLDTAAERLSEIIRTGTLHSKQMTDADGEAIEGHQCKYCTDELQRMITHKVRADKKRSVHRYFGTLISSLNGTTR